MMMISPLLLIAGSITLGILTQALPCRPFHKTRHYSLVFPRAAVVPPRPSLLTTCLSQTSIPNDPKSTTIPPTKQQSPQRPQQNPNIKSPSSATGKMKQRLYQSTSRESRISALELIQRNHPHKWSEAQEAELNGLLRVSSRFEEPYEESSFEPHHVEFKHLHNQAFLALIRYVVDCEKRHTIMEQKEEKPDVNVFFLDGPTGGTASVLIDQGGLHPSQCFVANRHESTCRKLRSSGGGPLPEENVIHASATEAFLQSVEGDMNGPLAHLDFAAYYFDGCGGYVPQILDMISAALSRSSPDDEAQLQTTAIGFSLLGGNKDVVEKELTICQALNKIARQHNMRVVHALDDPERYGIPSDTRKIGGAEGQTFTTWLILELDP